MKKILIYILFLLPIIYDAIFLFSDCFESFVTFETVTFLLSSLACSRVFIYFSKRIITEKYLSNHIQLYRIFIYALPITDFVVVTICLGQILIYVDNRFEIKDYLVLIATLSASLVALFKDRYDRYCYKPKLILDFDMDNNQLFSVEKMGTGVAGYMLRVKIRNIGLGWAENVMLRIEPLRNNSFPPMFLTWTNNFQKNNNERIKLNKIYLNVDYYCDLAEIRGNKKHDFILSTEVKPFNKSTRYAPYSVTKKYQPEYFKLTLFADNVIPISYYMILNYRQWIPVNRKALMKANGIFVQIKKQKKCQ